MLRGEQHGRQLRGVLLFITTSTNRHDHDKTTMTSPANDGTHSRRLLTVPYGASGQSISEDIGSRISVKLGVFEWVQVGALGDLQRLIRELGLLILDGNETPTATKSRADFRLVAKLHHQPSIPIYSHQG